MATRYYLALCTTPATLELYGVELAGNGYERAPIDLDFTTGPGTPRGRNLTPASFANPSRYAWPSVGWAELWTAPTGGDRAFPLSLVALGGGTAELVRVDPGGSAHVSVGGLLTFPGKRPYGRGRFGTGRYGTTKPIGTVALWLAWQLSGPCDAGSWGADSCQPGAWSPAGACSAGDWVKAS